MENNNPAEEKKEEEILEEADLDMEGVDANKHAVLADNEEEQETKVDMGGSEPEFSDFVEYLKSNKTWDDLQLTNELRQNLIARGFKKPSRIQASAISLFQKKNFNRDVIAQSQNGSGKT